jgi:hypothetical protein
MRWQLECMYLLAHTSRFLKVTDNYSQASDYCYLYDMADQYLRRRPKRMSLVISQIAGWRIGEHV